jgi:hypothetical protein
VAEQTTSTAEQPSVWRRHRIALALGALAVVGCVAGAALLVWRSAQNSPEAALVGLASAAVEGDADAVAASVDTTELVDSAVDDVLSDSQEQRAIIEQYLLAHPGATEQSIKSKARALLNEEMREHVESGTLPKRIPLPSGTIKQLAAKAFASGAVRSVRVDGSHAHVLVVVPYKGKTLRVRVRMTRRGEKWKVDRVENLSQVLKQAGY